METLAGLGTYRLMVSVFSSDLVASYTDRSSFRSSKPCCFTCRIIASLTHLNFVGPLLLSCKIWHFFFFLVTLIWLISKSKGFFAVNIWKQKDWMALTPSHSQRNIFCDQKVSILKTFYLFLFLWFFWRGSQRERFGRTINKAIRVEWRSRMQENGGGDEEKFEN